MLRQCDISGKRSNYAHRVTFSNKKNPKMQHPNLQTKTFFSPALNRNVNVKIACSTIRTIRKLGLDETAAHFGCDLSKF
jgi:large subunit ribosomal protein L28